MGILDQLFALYQPPNPTQRIDPASLPAQLYPMSAPMAPSDPQQPYQVAGNSELENLRRILAKDKGGGAKPINPPMSDEQILENLRRMLRENG